LSSIVLLVKPTFDAYVERGTLTISVDRVVIIRFHGSTQVNNVTLAVRELLVVHVLDSHGSLFSFLKSVCIRLVEKLFNAVGNDGHQDY
jgi:hypothetical protein